MRRSWRWLGPATWINRKPSIRNERAAPSEPENSGCPGSGFSDPGTTTAAWPSLISRRSMLIGHAFRTSSISENQATSFRHIQLLSPPSVAKDRGCPRFIRICPGAHPAPVRVCRQGLRRHARTRASAGQRAEQRTTRRRDQSREVVRGIARGERPFWQARYYDFNLWTADKETEKLGYMHRNPVARGLTAKPEDWKWSSAKHYLTGQDGAVKIESQWAAFRRRDQFPEELQYKGKGD